MSRSIYILALVLVLVPVILVVEGHSWGQGDLVAVRPLRYRSGMLRKQAPRQARDDAHGEACNLPPVYWPDGCQDAAQIGPPDEPIPPPCIQEAHVEEDLESYDEPTIRLVIAVAHPEYGPGLVDWVYFVREPVSGTTTGWVPVWHHYQRDSWDAACGKDEGPLTWATERLLQGDLGAVGIYEGPLPGEFLELVAELGGWRLYEVYLPVVGISER